MRDKTAGRVALFTTRTLRESPAAKHHAESGGIVACLHGEAGSEQFVIHDAERHITIASVQEVPLTFGGAAHFQLENILAAITAAYVQGLPQEQIRDGLLRFVPSAASTPGRLNVLETTRGRVIIDYAHNPAAMTGLLDFVSRTPAEQRMAIISVPGDRRDEDLREVGRLAAGMDYVIFKEHEHYRRGRAPGESARLLADGLLDTGFPLERIALFDDEAEAVAHAIERMKPGTVVAVIADAPETVALFTPYLVTGT
jgi:cyanophycin synthetase